MKYLGSRVTAKPVAPWNKYICVACGLIYDEEEGDLDSGLAPGTRFSDIPDDWECPVCGVTKKDFKLFVKQEQAMIPASTLLVKEKGIVIIGAGMAGWAMVEAIRARDNTMPITLITGCSGDRYNKPELSVSFSRFNNKKKSLLRVSAVEEAKRLGVKLISHTLVVSVSSRLHQVRTTRGTVSYKKLVIAQGAKTALPDNFPAHLCWRVNLLDDWSALRSRLQGVPKRIAIIGAGMAGCELAEDLRRMGHAVLLLSRNNMPLMNVLPKLAAKRLMSIQRNIGIGFVGSKNIVRIVQEVNGRKSIEFSSRDTLEVDEVIATTGVATDKRIAERAQLDFNNGISVNPDTLQTSQEDIYAVGDCVSFDGECRRYVGVIEQQVFVVADSLVNSSRGYIYKRELPPVVLKTKSCPIEIRGLPDLNEEWTVVEDSDNYLLITQLQQGKLSASISVGKAA